MKDGFWNRPYSGTGGGRFSVNMTGLSRQGFGAGRGNYDSFVNKYQIIFLTDRLEYGILTINQEKQWAKCSVLFSAYPPAAFPRSCKTF